MSKTNTLVSPADAVDEGGLVREKLKLWRENNKDKSFSLLLWQSINDGSVALGGKLARLGKW